MKKLNLLKRLLCLSLVAVAAAGCGDDKDDVLWDFAHEMVRVYVTDPSGRENRLDPDAERTIANDPIAVIYKGKRYELDRETLVVGRGGSDAAAAATRVIPVRFYGFCLRYTYRENWHLVFGEFDAEVGYEREPLTIDWGDGTTTEIAFDYSRTWKNGEPTTVRHIYVDGADRGATLECVLMRE